MQAAIPNVSEFAASLGRSVRHLQNVVNELGIELPPHPTKANSKAVLPEHQAAIREKLGIPEQAPEAIPEVPEIEPELIELSPAEIVVAPRLTLAGLNVESAISSDQLSIDILSQAMTEDMAYLQQQEELLAIKRGQAQAVRLFKLEQQAKAQTLTVLKQQAFNAQVQATNAALSDNEKSEGNP
jgi:hypothetical protein